MANDELEQGARLSRKSYNWNFGKLPRIKSEQLLTNESIGTFLIRESEHYPGDLTLSIKDDCKIQHYRIKFDMLNQIYTIEDETFFTDLHLLVKHYELDADGLCCRLEKPLQKKFNVVDSLTIEKVLPSVLRSVPHSLSVVDYKELYIGKLIGSGEFAEVHEGVHKNARVAIKVLKEQNSSERFFHEAEIMNSLKHRNIVQLLGIMQKPDHTICLVIEFMEKGSLLHYLTTRGRSIISQKDLIHFAIEICEGLTYLEQCLIVHRDIAASNVLIADDNTAKISDFGLAKSLELSGTENENSLTKEKIKCRTKWTSPEALELKIYTNKSDMWSYGVLLWEIFSYGRCPYPHIPADEVLINLKEGYRMEPPNRCPIEIGDIMRQSWHINMNRRPSFSQILERLKRINVIL